MMDFFSKIDASSVATIIAVIFSSIAAVLVTRFIDFCRERCERKMEVFRALMRTRSLMRTKSMEVHIEHTGALNLVEVEFADKKPVIDAWKNYSKKLQERLPQQEIRRNEMFEERDELLTKLIYAIATALRLKIWRLKVLKGRDLSQNWSVDERRQRIIQNLLFQVLRGRNAIVFRNEAEQKKNSPYPSRPQT